MIKINKPIPQCCDDCFACDEMGDYPYCRISHHSAGYTFDSAHRRMSDCPLIEEDSIPEARCTARPKMDISRYYGEKNTVMCTPTFYCPVCQTEVNWHASNCYVCGTALNWEALYDNA